MMAIPALLLLFIFKVIPAFLTMVISTKEYNIFEGVFGSPSAGMRVYSELFQWPEFSRILGNTFQLNIFSILLTSVFALILIMCISRMPGKILKLVSISILAVPAFVPVSSFVWVFARVFSMNNGFVNQLLIQSGMEPKLFFGDPSFYPLLFAMMDSMRNVVIPAMTLE